MLDLRVNELYKGLSSVANSTAGLPLAVMPRQLWSCSKPSLLMPLELPAQYIFCIHTNSMSCQTEAVCVSQLRRLERLHTERNGQLDIRYNFMIGGDGNVYEGRGWNNQCMLPRKFKDYQDKSLLLAFIGVFTEGGLPDHMVQRRRELIQYAISNNYLTKDFSAYEIFQA